jgi:DNA-binding CsgD family transcriptional regulator
VSTTIVGRTSELSIVQRVLEEIRHGPAGVMIEGDIGAGKTTLWRAAVASAHGMGHRVLEAHPAESEESLPYAALGDLLEGVVDDPDLQLPAPQQRALRVAVLLDEPDDGPPDQRAVSVATLTALRSLSKRSPVVVAIDDFQWMDGPSARVLEFVVRRLQHERLGVVAARRTTRRAKASGLFDRSFPGRDAHRLSLAPLETDALDALLRTQLGTSLPRATVAQVERASGGNPLFALEIARGIQRGEIRPQTGEPLSVPATLQQYARERLSHLPREVRDLLFVAAAVTDPTIELLEATAPPEAVSVAMEVAALAGVLEVSSDRLQFVHPLYASTLYHAVSPSHRRALHRQLAPLVPGADERARHLALGADGPDPQAATAVEAAAQRASARGAPDAAAELAERAHELTPSDNTDDRERRRIHAGEYHFMAGNLNRARQIFEEMAAVLAPGPVRASVLRRLAKVRYRNDSCSIAAQLLTRALAEAGEDRMLRAQVERDLAWAVMLCGDMGAAAGHAKSALELIAGPRDDPMFAEVLAATAMAEFLQGGGFPAETIRRAVSLEGTDSDTPIEWRPSMMLGMMLNWSGATSEARRRFNDLRRQALDAGEETSLPFLFAQMSESATWEGDLTAGMRHAEEALAMSLQTGQEPMRAAALYAKALAEAHLGNLDDARTSAHAGLELAEAVGSVVMMMWNQTVLGFVELSVDEPAAAHEHLAPLVAWREVVGIREPGMLRFLPDEIEALVALGELEKADALLIGYEEDAARLQRPWAQLAAARSRALHTAAAGDSVAAVAGLRAVLDEHENGVQPFERARALFVLGSIQRRTRRRKDARESLQAAQKIFDELGARTWSVKARRLTKTPNHRTGDVDLTPAELRVAQVVAGGATNREAAARLFVSVRTIELHLTSVYRKLAVRSRTELAARMAAEAQPGRPEASALPRSKTPNQ